MTLIFGLLLILLTVLTLIKGNLFKGTINKLKANANDYMENEYERDSEEFAINSLRKMTPIAFYGICFLSIQLTFMIQMLTFDPLLIATIGTISLYIYEFATSLKIISDKNKKEHKNEEVNEARKIAKKILNIKTKLTNRTITFGIVYIAYYLVAVYSLLFLI